ncbi:uncharacterized protein FN964_007387 isoform 1-T2 [Alca torda]
MPLWKAHCFTPRAAPSQRCAGKAISHLCHGLWEGASLMSHHRDAKTEFSPRWRLHEYHSKAKALKSWLISPASPLQESGCQRKVLPMSDSQDNIFRDRGMGRKEFGKIWSYQKSERHSKDFV